MTKDQLFMVTFAEEAADTTLDKQYLLLGILSGTFFGYVLLDHIDQNLLCPAC